MPDRPKEERKPDVDVLALFGVLKDLGLNGDGIAELFHVSAMKISRWKTGRTEPPNEFKVCCRALVGLHRKGVDVVSVLKSPGQI